MLVTLEPGARIVSSRGKSFSGERSVTGLRSMATKRVFGKVASSAMDSMFELSSEKKSSWNVCNFLQGRLRTVTPLDDSNGEPPGGALTLPFDEWSHEESLEGALMDAGKKAPVQHAFPAYPKPPTSPVEAAKLSAMEQQLAAQREAQAFQTKVGGWGAKATKVMNAWKTAPAKIK